MQSSGNGSNGLPPPLAEINVTPLVDVVLVLLIIFMVSAPLLDADQGVEIEPPEVADGQPLDQPERDHVVVTLDADGKVFISKQEVAIDDLSDKIAGILEAGRATQVFFKGDRSVPYGVAVDVMARLRKGGVENLGMVTVQPEGRS